VVHAVDGTAVRGLDQVLLTPATANLPSFHVCDKLLAACFESHITEAQAVDNSSYDRIPGGYHERR
jgi:hypothetical protein